ncbi:alpha carbonic anhydrase 4-like [Andrographis paniculata]|uniref:alpha carbonic anhydrase 4-like n=1 Tax=Andrographis paniculata TaxID=175694 RepID=UPI0021E775DE|nr:alpha carbonic anhydrase 4-like [Andrographis paniculata]
MLFDNIYSRFNLLKFLLLVSILFLAKAITNPEVDDERPFSYDVDAPNGPPNWGILNPNWTLCETGKSQSPVNIFTRRVVVQPSFRSVRRRYKPAPAVIKNRGHDIEVELTGDGGGIIINRIEYKLVQLHWHIPSEHTVNGVRYDMELHLVHVTLRGDIAVVGLLYMLGSSDLFLRRISPYLQSANEKGVNLGIIKPSNIKFRGKEYFRYNGSLTTPPCSENVIWTVLKKVQTVSMQQIRAVKDAVDDGGAGNARPTHPLNGRSVYFHQRK